MPPDFEAALTARDLDLVQVTVTQSDVDRILAGDVLPHYVRDVEGDSPAVIVLLRLKR
jgi:hypothetical protein